MNVSAPHTSGLKIPFDHQRLDRLMDEAGIDVIVATSKHNCQYLTGGHRANFFDYMDATGITTLSAGAGLCQKAHRKKAAYFGHRLEKFQREVNPMWTPEPQTNTAGSVDAMQKAVDYIRKTGLKTKRIAAEYGFLPYDAANVLRAAFPDADWVDALYVLERQRAKEIAGRTRQIEIRLGSRARLNEGGDRQSRPRLDQGRGGRSAAPRGNQSWANLRVLPHHLRHQPQPRAVGAEMGEWRHHMSIDSGGNYHGLYRRHLPHMAVQDEPDAETQRHARLRSETIQRAAMKPVKAGVMGQAKSTPAVAEVLRSKIKAQQPPRLPRPRHGSRQP